MRLLIELDEAQRRKTTRRTMARREVRHSQKLVQSFLSDWWIHDGLSRTQLRRMTILRSNIPLTNDGTVDMASEVDEVSTGKVVIEAMPKSECDTWGSGDDELEP